MYLMLRKITDFIVEKRNWILGLFAILTIAGVCVMGNVNINRDMTAYLPEDSSTRIGLDLMTREFGEDSTSDLTVMFQNLTNENKQALLEYFQNLEGVSEIAYDESEEYNRDGYTRFILTIDGSADSAIAKQVYETINNADFNEYLEKDLSGSVEDENGEVLHFSIIVLAVVCALIILIIMSESYIEPFLFLTTILIAVVLNKATNLIFPSVSNITDSIVAILQMALSMDYSIMLMNRYIQERETEPNRVKAMKKALYASFAAISSSSITTIVGLLALVFMSFTIGRDLGFVLAKGVLFSLIAIFTCLPGLILMCDKLIAKTKKPSPHFKMQWAGNLAHKLRFVGLPIFLIVFVACFLFKGNLGIYYSSPLDNKVEEVFGSTNQFALLYDNTDEHQVAEYCRSLGADEKIDQVLCYGNTIGDGLTTDALVTRMSDLGADIEVEDYLLRLVYYYYYHNGQGDNLTLNQFVQFIQTEIAQNPAFSERLTPAMLAKISQLNNFATVNNVTRQRNAAELASALEIEAEQVEDLLIYYNSHSTTTTISLENFVNFMQTYVLKSKYGASFNTNQRASLTQLSSMIQLAKMQKGLDAATMSQVFGMESTLVQQVYLAQALQVYLAENPQLMQSMATSGVNVANLSLPEIMQMLQAPVQQTVQQKAAALTMTPSNFLSLVVQNLNQVDAGTQAQIKLVQQIFQLTQSGTRLSAPQMANLMGIATDDAKLLYSLYDVKQLSKNITLSLNDFVAFLTTDVMNNPKYASNFDGTTQSKLLAIQQIMQNTMVNKIYTPSQLVSSLSTFTNDLSQDLVELIYLYYGSVNHYDNSWQLSVETFVNYLDRVVLVDTRFNDLVEDNMRSTVRQAVVTVADAKKLLVGENYARIVLQTQYDEESEETFAFIDQIKQDLSERTNSQYYVVGNSLMAYEMSQSFDDEMNLITILTMIFIFVVVAVTFKSFIIPIILVALIQCAVFFTMGVMTVADGEMYFIALLIVQSILMGATIDYAILYTSYYLEARHDGQSVKAALGYAYTDSMHAIMTSGLILILVTLIVGQFASSVAAKICMAISQGTICSIVLILILLPAILAGCDKFITKKRQHQL